MTVRRGMADSPRETTARNSINSDCPINLHRAPVGRLSGSPPPPVSSSGRASTAPPPASPDPASPATPAAAAAAAAASRPPPPTTGSDPGESRTGVSSATNGRGISGGFHGLMVKGGSTCAALVVKGEMADGPLNMAADHNGGIAEPAAMPLALTGHTSLPTPPTLASPATLSSSAMPVDKGHPERKRRASSDSLDSSTKASEGGVDDVSRDDDEDNDDDDDEKMSVGHDPERLKAFNMFVRLFVDENLDRVIPISKQPKDKIQAILDACDRQFPEFHERSRKRVRTYLKSCRRMRRSKEANGWEQLRPTPPHLTSAAAEGILAVACENESNNAKRMRMGMDPLPAAAGGGLAATAGTPLPMAREAGAPSGTSANGSSTGAGMTLPASHDTPPRTLAPSQLPSQHSPVLQAAAATVAAAAAAAAAAAERPSQSMAGGSGGGGGGGGGGAGSIAAGGAGDFLRHLPPQSTTAFRPPAELPSPFFANNSGIFRPGFPNNYQQHPAHHHHHHAPVIPHTPLSAQVQNGPTDLSMKKSANSPSKNQLNASEVATIKQLVAGYRESAAFLYRSADELEQLLLQQN